jgi:hypothetical protein
MHTRSRAAATTALLLTASVTGLAAFSGSAQATAQTHTAARSAPTLTVKITSTSSGPRLSVDTIRPGNTVFKVYRGGAGGSMQLMRLKSGYSLKQAENDFGGLFTGNVKAVRRIDKNVVFYGGIDVPAKGVTKPNQWGTKVDATGRYYVVNLEKNTLATLQAKGASQKRSLPATGGYVNMADDAGANVFKTPAVDPHKGWMKTTNRALEPHFVVLNGVQEATTDQDVTDYIAASAGNPSAPPPSWALPTGTETNVISPGHSFVWKYAVPKGKYIAMCFWPSKGDGTPHFDMGMFKLFHLQ